MSTSQLSEKNIISPSEGIKQSDEDSEEASEDEDVEEDDAAETGQIPDIDPFALSLLLQRAEQVWPSPSSHIRVPDDWSTDWTKWPLLPTLFWFSPYYLRLPQIEMLVNIQYAIPGEVRPRAYWEDGSFVFNTERQGQAGEGEFYLLKARSWEIYRVFGVDGEEALFSLLGQKSYDELLKEAGRLESNAEGEHVLQRLMKRDQTVIPELERFLGYQVQEELGAIDDAINEGKLSPEIQDALAKAQESGEVDADPPVLVEDGMEEDDIEEALKSDDDELPRELQQHLEGLQLSASEELSEEDRQIFKQLEEEDGELTQEDLDKLQEILKQAEQRLAALESVDKEFEEEFKRILAEAAEGPKKPER